ncbi:MAG: hypothetical protein SGJ13_10660 [Actinomycetota bacterium]|nr:hypothetical protein [Actinomycetota bacterium]
MQPSSYFKQSGLASAPQGDAVAWLVSRLRWERVLDRLRTERPERPEALDREAA